MSNTVIQMSASGAKWAEQGIDAPFFYVPFDFALLSTPVNARTITNIDSLVDMIVIDGGTNGNVDDNEGYITFNGFNEPDDGDATWFGNTQDGIGKPIYNMFNVFNKSLHTTGATILISYKFSTSGGGLNPALSFGSVGGDPGVHTWELNHVPSLGQLRFVANNEDFTSTGIQALTTTALNDGDEHNVTILIDTALRNIYAHVDGASNEVTPEVELAILDVFRDLVNPISGGVTFFATPSDNNAGVRNISSSYNGLVRDLFVMNLSNLEYDSQELADLLTKAPPGTIPQALGRY